MSQFRMHAMFCFGDVVPGRLDLHGRGVRGLADQRAGYRLPKGLPVIVPSSRCPAIRS